MAESYAIERPAAAVAVPSAKTASIFDLVMPLLILFVVFLCVMRQSPPAVLPANAPATEFSAERAAQHLKEIANKAHPVGSAEHAKVREYISSELSKLGLSPEVQETTGLNAQDGPPYRAATVHNILGRLKGTANSKALLLVGHYDSVPTGPGASDDGSAVAAMLETLRALRTGAALKNDIIFLFTDAEEVGLLGAEGFVDEHAWSRDVGVVLNFEARGNGGPAMMFETSGQNGWLIGEFAKAAPRPSATSLSYEIYRLLPNYTDLTVFKRAGFSSLNFAFIKGVVNYHSSFDNINTMDARSLQHQGSYMLPLARHFANLDLRETKASDAVYFDLLGLTLVHYPSNLILPLMVLTLLVFAGVVILGFRKGLLRVSRVVLGFFIFLLSLILSALLVSIVWWLLQLSHSGYSSLLVGDTYNSDWYLLGFSALTVALFTFLYALFRKRIGTENLAVGALMWWLMLMVLTALFVPGASYLFTWPLLFSLLGLGFAFIDGKPQEGAANGTTKSSVALLLGALPGLVLLVPLIYLIFLALTVSMSAALMILVVLLLGLLIPQLLRLTASYRWPVLGVMLAVVMIAIGIGSFTSDFDKGHPKPDNLLYGLNADTGQAVWASADNAPDEWTSQVLNGNLKREKLPAYFPSSRRLFLESDAAATELPAPLVQLLSETRENDARTLRLHITSARQAPVINVNADANAQIVRSAINGRPIEGEGNKQTSNNDAPWSLFYYGLPAEGIDVTMETKSNQPVNLTIVDQSYGLPEVSGAALKPRPDYMRASIFPFSDSTFVSKSYQF